MKKILSLIVLIFFVYVCFAINPSELIGNPFTFNHLYTNNWGFHDDIKLDCFYNYTASSDVKKQINKKNRYYSEGKYTIPDSVYGHRFIGVDFFNSPKKGSYFIMIDDKGDSLIMTLPKFNPDKEYQTYKKSYAHKNISTQKKWYENFSNHFFTAVEITAYPLKEFETNLESILSTQNNNFQNEALPIPVYNLINIYYPESSGGSHVPKVSLLKNYNDTLSNLSEKDIQLLSNEVSNLYRKINVLTEYISSFDTSIFDSISPYLGQDIWIDSKLLNDGLFYSPNSYIGDKFYSGKIKYNRWDYSFSDDAKWAYKSEGYLSSAAFGGPVYNFGFAHISDIVLKPNLRSIVEQELFNDQKRLGYAKSKTFTPSDSLEFRYYVALSRCPDSLYVDETKNIKKLGKEFSDTIFIELDQSTIHSFIPVNKFNEIKDGFYEREQLAWNAFSDEQKAYFDIATRAWGEEIANIVCRGEVRLGFDEDMCHFAFMRTPYRTSSQQTPLGRAECHYFFQEGVKMYFQNKILIGLEWRGNSLFEPRHRY